MNTNTNNILGLLSASIDTRGITYWGEVDPATTNAWLIAAAIFVVMIIASFAIVYLTQWEPYSIGDLFATLLVVVGILGVFACLLALLLINPLVSSEQKVESLKLAGITDAGYTDISSTGSDEFTASKDGEYKRLLLVEQPNEPHVYDLVELPTQATK